MLDSKNFIKKVFIAKNIARSAGATAGTVAKANVLADGEIVVTDLAGRILNSTTVLGQQVIQIRQGRGIKTPPIKIAEIPFSGVNLYKGDAFEAAREQVTFIGYNGSTGDFEATGATEKRFIAKITPAPNTMIFGIMPFNVKDTLFVSPASTTKTENAIGMLKQFILSYIPNRNIDFNPKFELVASDAGTAIANLTNMVFTKHSRLVTVTAGSSITIAAGAYIKINDGSTATQRPVYRVQTGGTGTSFTISLEWQFQGNSGTVLAASITGIAAGALTTVGLKVSGVPFRYDVNRWRQYDKMRFYVQLVNGFTTTTVTDAVGAFEGVGTWQQTQNDEYIGWGDEGQINPMQLPPLFREQDAEVNNNYSVLNIGFENSVEDTMVATGRLKGNFMLYLNKTSGSFGTNIVGVGSPNTGLVNVLDAWAAQKPGLTAQIGNL
jgi:hypothetical protein